MLNSHGLSSRSVSFPSGRVAPETLISAFIDPLFGRVIFEDFAGPVRGKLIAVFSVQIEQV
jgi:hypothetical protein